MITHYIILGLFALIFIGAVTMMIKTDNTKRQVESSEDKHNTKKMNKKLLALSITSCLCFAVMLCSAIYILVVSAYAETRPIPETEVIETIPIVESTSAPDKTNIPDIKVNIQLKDELEGGKRLPPLREAPSDPVIEEIIPTIDPEELEMLACVIYQEAGGNGSCDDCRRYVADVVLNRVNHPKFPNTIYKVLTAQNQYGLFYYTGIKWPERAKYDTEKEAVARAYRIAEEVLSGQHSKLYGQGYIWQAEFIQGTDGFWCCGHFYGR